MLPRSDGDKAKTSKVAITKVGIVADLFLFLDKSVDVAGKVLKEKDIIFGEKFKAEHSTFPRRKLLTSLGLGIPQQTTRKAIDMNIVVIMDQSRLNFCYIFRNVQLVPKVKYQI